MTVGIETADARIGAIVPMGAVKAGAHARSENIVGENPSDGAEFSQEIAPIA